MGESPGIRYMRSSRKNQGPVVQAVPPSLGCAGPSRFGRALAAAARSPTVASSPWLNTRRRRMRSISSLSLESNGSTLTGSGARATGSTRCLRSRGDVLGRQAELARQRLCEAAAHRPRCSCRARARRQTGGVVPDRLAVGAPADRQRPARQLLAGVPLALAEVQEAALAVFGAQACAPARWRSRAWSGPGRRCSIRRASRSSVATKVGSPPMVRRTSPASRRSTVVAQGHHVVPLLVGVGQGDAGRFVDARDLHVVGELDLALVHAAFDGRGA
jgi:hypothetical protein